MMRALDSAIGFPSRPTSASSMLGLLMPEEVRRSFMRPPGWLLQARTLYALRDPYAVETGRSSGDLGHDLDEVPIGVAQQCVPVVVTRVVRRLKDWHTGGRQPLEGSLQVLRPDNDDHRGAAGAASTACTLFA